jgi:hypothetical protein
VAREWRGELAVNAGPVYFVIAIALFTALLLWVWWVERPKRIKDQAKDWDRFEKGGRREQRRG